MSVLDQSGVSLSTGVAEGQGTAGVVVGREVWDELKITHNVRSISDGPASGLEQDIEFAVFREGLGLFAEVTTHLKPYRAIVLADVGFAQTGKEELENANPISVFLMQVSLCKKQFHEMIIRRDRQL